MPTPTPGFTVTLLPNGDDDVAFNPSGAGTNWACVTANDGETSYIHTSTNSELDSYNMEDLAVTGTITAVRAYAWARKTSTSALTMRMGIRIGSTYYYGDVATTQTYALYGGAADGCEWTVNPSTSNPWTVSEVNDLIGFVQHAGVNGRQLRVTQLYLEVDITP